MEMCVYNNVSLILQAGAMVPVAVKAMSTGMLLQFRGYRVKLAGSTQHQQAVCAADRTVFEMYKDGFPS